MQGTRRYNSKPLLILTQQRPQTSGLDVSMMDDVDKPVLLPASLQQPAGLASGRVHALPFSPDAERLFHPRPERDFFDDGGGDDLLPRERAPRYCVYGSFAVLPVGRGLERSCRVSFFFSASQSEAGTKSSTKAF